MSIAAFPPDRPDLGVPLHLIGPAEALDLSSLVVGEPTFERTIDGPSTVTLDVADHRRTILKSGALNTRNFTAFDGVRFEQASISKNGDLITFVFEDAIVRALKRQKSAKSWAAGTLTRTALAKLLAAEAGIPIAADPQTRTPLSSATTRNMTGKSDGLGSGGTTYTADPDGTDTSWSLLGSLASEVNWRVCSDGERLLFGSDAWLMARSPAITLREREGAVQTIDFELDSDQRASSATVTVDVDRWAIPAGQPVTLTGMGPADGKWLVESFRRPFKRNRGTVSLTRERATLMEPVSTADGTGDAGELDFLSDSEYGSTAPSGSAAAIERANSGPLGRFLAFALQQSGKPYVLGASGPNAYDCSGLVAAAANAAGINFPKPVTEQVGRIRRGQGTFISVAEGLRTRGALLFRSTPGGSNGNGNHIVISLTGGQTMEARGKAYGCGIFGNAQARQWDGAAILNFTQSNAVGTGQIGGPR